MTAPGGPDAHDPTAWFEQLYGDAAAGTAVVPWDLPNPGAGVVEWAQGRELTGVRTLVVGCGYGRDAEYLAGRGADVTAFDIAPTAVSGARERHPDTAVTYLVADLLSPPTDWLGAFDLVVENMNVQALPEPLRSDAIAAVGRFVAPGGTLVATEAARADDAPAEPGPPWPFLRAEMESFGSGVLTLVALDGTDPLTRWRAEFHRPTTVPVPERLYHVALREDWDEAVRSGAYVWSTRGITVADEGFVHLSRAEQVAGTLRLFYADVPGELVLLVVDPELTHAEMKLEDGFFHTYGELPVTAVVEVLPIVRGVDGGWVAPVS
ncbi:DUF952 domain-containing protein [Jatrophihabitans sp. YIM 134969]